MSMTREGRTPNAYIGLGSNLNDPEAQVRLALDAIGRIDGVSLVAVSSLYRSPPMGPKEQPDYCNAVCAVDSSIEPSMLMGELLEIERRAGRVRGGERWGARRIDLDLLYVVGVSSATSGLRLPHPGIANRNFVLAPLAEIAPGLEIPGVGVISELMSHIVKDDLSIWSN